MKGWSKRVGVGLGGMLAVAAVAGAAYEQLGRRGAAIAFPPSGDIVRVDGRDVHLDCRGEGSPIAILEAGFDLGGSVAWAPVHDELAALTRTCAYDRAGILWSERGEEPRDAHAIADELRALLDATGESPPYLMVAHSLGGPLVRTFDARHPGRAVGFVFVDSSHPEQIGRFPPEARAPLQSGGLDILSRVSRTFGVARLGSGEPSGPRAAHAIRTLPGLTAERVGIPTMFDQAAATGRLQDRPVVVLTAGRSAPPPAWSEETAAAVREVWLELQAELAGLSTNSDHRVVEGAGHYVQVDAPAAVVDAVRDVLDALRLGSRLGRADEGGA